jgi:hypothetical protein
MTSSDIEQHAVAVADLAHPGEVPLGWGEAPAGVLHRFEEHRRDRLGALLQDGALDVVGAAQRARRRMRTQVTSVAVGVRHVEGAGHERFERHPQRGDPGDGERPHRRAVVGDVAGDDLVAAGLADGLEVLAGELPGRLDRLGAAGGEEHPVEVAGGELGELGGELDGGGVGVGPDREVGEGCRLCAGRLGQFGAAVADLHGEQAAEPVEVPPPVLVPDVAALTPLDDLEALALARRERGEVTPEVGGGEVLQLGGVAHVRVSGFTESREF